MRTTRHEETGTKGRRQIRLRKKREFQKPDPNCLSLVISLDPLEKASSTGERTFCRNSATVPMCKCDVDTSTQFRGRSLNRTSDCTDNCLGIWGCICICSLVAVICVTVQFAEAG